MRLNYKVSLHLSVMLVRNCWHSSLLLHPSRDNYRSEFYDTIHLVFSAIISSLSSLTFVALVSTRPRPAGLSNAYLAFFHFHATTTSAPPWSRKASLESADSPEDISHVDGSGETRRNNHWSAKGAIRWISQD